MRYEVKYNYMKKQEVRPTTDIIEATNFSVIRNTIVFYNKGISVYAFNNVISVKKLEEGDYR